MEGNDEEALPYSKNNLRAGRASSVTLWGGPKSAVFMGGSKGVDEAEAQKVTLGLYSIITQSNRDGRKDPRDTG